ncbi:MAG: TrkH family potassium uptake protein [Candidatus Puniceispirillaceae bacterium]
MRFTPVLNILGILLAFLACAMLLPMMADLLAGNANWQAFAISALVTGFIGVGLWIANHETASFDLGLRQAFLLTNGAWISIGLFGALPFLLSDLNLSVSDAVFESVSGITTTGSTILPMIEKASSGILLWRALLQWLGGVGIVVMAMAVLPMLSVGGMQLFKTESYDSAEKVIPRATQLAGGIFVAYTALTAIWALMLGIAGMPSFDALAHAMTTIATGGYSTRTLSIGAFDSWLIEAIIIGGMIVGSLPFAHYVALTHGGWQRLLKDPQVRLFLGLMIIIILFITMNLAAQGLTAVEAFRMASFNAVSILTGTGYGTANFAAWGGFATTILLISMFIGGCAGSTTCGVKIFRLQVLASTIKVQIARLLRPHGVVLAYYNKRPVSDSVMDAVMGFFYLYILCFVILAAILGLTGLDFDTALSGAATAISNVGPGLGDIIGPAGHFGELPNPAKWAMCVGMILGRLELFTVLVMLHPGFWRR